jgi:hypothetical protein
MAIIPGVQGLKVDILVDRYPAPEYVDPDETDFENGDGTRTITKFIEAQSNAEFTVRFTLSPGFPYQRHDIIFQVYLDGEWMDGASFRLNTLRSFQVAELTGQRYVRNNQWFQRNFKFAQLNIGMLLERRAAASVLTAASRGSLTKA